GESGLLTHNKWLVDRLKGLLGKKPSTIPSGTQLAQQLGRAGESAAGIVKNTSRIPSLSGTASFRVPDVLDFAAGVVGEVKNVSQLSYTQQLRDFAAFAKDQGLRFELTVRQGTRLSKPLQRAVDAGDITLRRLLP
ncbi:MAG: putative toxin, partial [Myxococcota bacterium]